jgi:4-hydroxyphenylpyruvate dioxygenase
VDFVDPGRGSTSAPVAGLHWFGLVQYVGPGRIEDWSEFYRGSSASPPFPTRSAGILPKGRVLKSPGSPIYLQLVAPEPDVVMPHGSERLQRIGLGTRSVPEAVRALRERGVEFYVSDNLHIEDKGALTRAWMGGLMFELVRDPGAKGAAG